MSKRAKKHLKKYGEECVEQMLHISLTRYISAPGCMDTQINLLGAMHQAMWLSNQTGGYLQEFEGSSESRIRRAMERIIESPYDDLALRTLSYHRPAELLQLVSEFLPHRVFAFMEGPVYSVGFCAKRVGSVFVNYFEIQWEDPEEVVRLHYAKALSNTAPDSVNNQYYSANDAGLAYGPCTTSRYMAVGQPYGFWYEYEGKLELPDESQIKTAITNVDKWIKKL